MLQCWNRNTMLSYLFQKEVGRWSCVGTAGDHKRWGRCSVNMCSRRCMHYVADQSMGGANPRLFSFDMSRQPTSLGEMERWGGY